MSQVLYRKYRPKLFSEIIGQEHITRTLQNEIKTGRLVHSYLFTGPRGIGKTTIARLLAKSLNCTEKKEGEPEPCNKCGHCESVNLGNALNIIEIDAASHTGVDNVRDKIIENVRFAPSGSKYKVFIIDEAHMLSISAFNALLKTLEEPPEDIVFVLATTELHKIPATILSRCQRFDFKKPTVKQIVERLEKLAKLEEIKADKKVLERVAHLSEGGMRDAEGLFGQILSLGIKDIKEEDADLVLPKSDLGLALNFLEFLINKNGREAMILTQDLQEKGVNLKCFTDQLIELARKLLYLKITGEHDEVLTEDMNKKLSTFSENCAQDEIIKILDIIIARRGDINNLDIPSLPLELAVAEICGENRETKRETAESRNNAKEENKTIGYQVSNSGDIKEIESRWPEILEKIKDHNHSLPFVLKMSKPIGFDGTNLILAIKFKLHQEKLEDPKNRDILTNVLKSVYNRDILIKTQVDESLQIEIRDTDEVDVEGEFGE
ncbi:DNA polymerase III subunit gamma/tau [Patescibacteria group bacterium]|nr:DNA polymerase III subunit gamma/tau [Patescibacteria group bacterium]